MNWITFKCGVIDGTLTSAELSLDPGQGDYGDYGHWSGLCELSKYTQSYPGAISPTWHRVGFYNQRFKPLLVTLKVLILIFAD